MAKQHDGQTPHDWQEIRDALAERRQIAIFWSEEDVRAVRPDLDEDRAWEVLQRVEHRHDGDRGITWDTIESTSREMFPDPDPFTTAWARSLPPASPGAAESPLLTVLGEFRERDRPPPSLTESILSNPRAFLPESGQGKDDGHGNENGPERGR